MEFTTSFLKEILTQQSGIRSTVYNKMHEFHDNYTINCSAGFEYENKFYRFNYEKFFNPEKKQWSNEFCESKNGIMECLEIIPIEKTITKYVVNWD